MHLRAIRLSAVSNIPPGPYRQLASGIRLKFESNLVLADARAVLLQGLEPEARHLLARRCRGATAVHGEGELGEAQGTDTAFRPPRREVDKCDLRPVIFGDACDGLSEVLETAQGGEMVRNAGGEVAAMMLEEDDDLEVAHAVVDGALTDAGGLETGRGGS